jgi:surface antigen
MNLTLDVRPVPSYPATTPWARRIAYRAMLALLIALPCIAMASPPPWAPAHGWRKKHDPAYAGYSGRHWDKDYGVTLGRCDRAAVGAVLGGVAGGVIGHEVGKDSNKAVATVIGAVIGATIGAEIGRQMDKTDRSCVGHSLELAGPGKTVAWTNHNTGITYRLTPAGRSDAATGCRQFRLTATGGFGLSEGRTVACPANDGIWNLAPDARLGQR